MLFTLDSQIEETKYIIAFAIFDDDSKLEIDWRLSSYPANFLYHLEADTCSRYGVSSTEGKHVKEYVLLKSALLANGLYSCSVGA